jgi:hypothetical protein
MEGPVRTAFHEYESHRRTVSERRKGPIMKNRKVKTSETICSSIAPAAWITTRALSLLIAACASPAYSQPFFQQQAARIGAASAIRSAERKEPSVETLAPGIKSGTKAVTDPENAEPPPTSASAHPLNFEERFSYDLNDYWCENHLAVADFDRDGLLDILLLETKWNGNGHQTKAILLHNEGNWRFTDSVVLPESLGYGYSAIAVDVNNDGWSDLVLRTGTATHVLLNDREGHFSQVSTFQPGYYALTATDVNNDGYLDLISGTQTGIGGLVELFTNSPGSGFTKSWQSRLYGSGYDSIETVLTANLNGDDATDLVAREIYSGLLITFLGTRGANPFTEHTILPFGDRTFALATGKIDGDALTDMAAHVGWGQVRVFLSQGDGSVSEYWRSPDLGQAAFNLALSDFDRDGLDDIFVGTFGDGALRVYRNTPPGQFELAWSSQLSSEGYTGTVADLDGDGLPDLIVGEKSRIHILRNVRANQPPLADASATMTFAIAADQHATAVMLDGSRSSDPDNDPLQYFWRLDDGRVATGMVAKVLAPIGSHTIELQVNDGHNTGTDTINLLVLTPSQAVDRLMTEASASNAARNNRPLMATLQGARKSFDSARPGAAFAQLRAFQNQVRAQVARFDSTLAEELISAAQLILSSSGETP